MPSRWTSRKFLLALSAQIAALLVLLWPQRQSEIMQITQSLAALVVMVLTALGYIHAETSLDHANMSSANPSAKDTTTGDPPADL